MRQPLHVRARVKEDGVGRCYKLRDRRISPIPSVEASSTQIISMRTGTDRRRSTAVLTVATSLKAGMITDSVTELPRSSMRERVKGKQNLV